MIKNALEIYKDLIKYLSLSGDTVGIVDSWIEKSAPRLLKSWSLHLLSKIIELFLLNGFHKPGYKLIDQAILSTKNIKNRIDRENAVKAIANAAVLVKEPGKSIDFFRRIIHIARNFEDIFARMFTLIYIADMGVSQRSSVSKGIGKFKRMAAWLRSNIKRFPFCYFFVILFLKLLNETLFRKRSKRERDLDDFFYNEAAYPPDETAQSQTLAYKKQFKQAVQLIEKNSETVDRAPALARISIIAARQKDFKPSVEIALKIEDSKEKNYAVSEILRLLKKEDEIDVSILRDLKTGDYDGDVRFELAMIYMKKNQLEEALRFSKKINSFEKKAEAFEIIAQRIKKPEELSLFNDYLKNVNLSTAGWTMVLNTWRKKLLEYSSQCSPYLWDSLNYQPFEPDLSYSAVYSIASYYILSNKLEAFYQLVSIFPQLNLNYLVPKE